MAHVLNRDSAVAVAVGAVAVCRLGLPLPVLARVYTAWREIFGGVVTLRVTTSTRVRPIRRETALCAVRLADAVHVVLASRQQRKHCATIWTRETLRESLLFEPAGKNTRVTVTEPKLASEIIVGHRLATSLLESDESGGSSAFRVKIVQCISNSLLDSLRHLTSVDAIRYSTVRVESSCYTRREISAVLLVQPTSCDRADLKHDIATSG
jgi:hypothetical protein